MERHSITEEAAFKMLRDHSRTANRKLIDISSAVVDGHRLLPQRPQTASGWPRPAV
jgi:AmiR/NasT family two-component response regulator